MSLFQLLLEVCSSHLLIWLSILLDGCGLNFIPLQISLLYDFSLQLFPSPVSLLCSVLSCSYPSFLHLFLTFLSPPFHLFILLIPSILPSIVFLLSYLSLLSLKLSVHSDPTPPSSSCVFCMPAFIPPSLILCFSPPPSRLAHTHFVHTEYSGCSSFTNAQDLWMTTAGLHCHHKIAGVLYMREMGGRSKHVCLVPI